MPTYTEEAYFLTSAVHVEPSGFKASAVSFEHSPKLDANLYANAIANVLQKFHPHLNLTYLCSSTDEKSVFVQYQISGVGPGKLETLITDTKDAISMRFTELLAKAEITLLPTGKADNHGVIIKPPAGMNTMEIATVAQVVFERNSFKVNSAQYV